jgi:hypothetical protein
MGYGSNITLDTLYKNKITKAKAKKLIDEHKKHNRTEDLSLPNGHWLNYIKGEYYLIKSNSDSGIIFSPYITGLKTQTIQSEDRLEVKSRYVEAKDMVGSFYKRVTFKDIADEQDI